MVSRESGIAGDPTVSKLKERKKTASMKESKHARKEDSTGMTEEIK